MEDEAVILEDYSSSRNASSAKKFLTMSSTVTNLPF